MALRNEMHDNAKGIGLLLVILGHLFSFGGIPSSLIYSFHMPLFFYVSGCYVNGGGGKKVDIEVYNPLYIFSIYCGSTDIVRG